MLHEIKINENKRGVLIVFLILFCIAGILFYVKGELHIEEIAEGKEVIELSKGSLSQKLIGNDYILKKIEFPISDIHIEDNSELTIFFTRKSDILSDSDILDIRMITGSELQNMDKITLEYPFTKLKYSTDYYIIFSGEKLSEEDTISFKKADGNENLAYVANYFLHKNTGFLIWKVLFIIYATAFATVLLLEISFWRALGVDIIVDCLILYIIGLIDTFAVILPVFYVLAIASTIYIIYCVFKEKKLKIYSSDICEAVVFLVLLALFAGQSRIQNVWAWDEMTHWATTVKNMWVFERMPQHKLYSGFNFRYPPGYSLFQLLFVKLNSAYSEHVLYWGKYIMESMIGLSVLADFRKKNRTKWFYLLVIALIMLLPAIAMGSATRYTNTLYADIVVGFATGMVFVSLMRYVRDGGRIQGIELIGAVILINLIKESGMIVCIALLIGVGVTFMLIKIRKKEAKCQYIKAIIMIAGGLAISRISWGVFLKSRMEDINYTVSVQASVSDAIGINMQTIVDYFMGRGKSYQYELLWNHLKELIVGKYYKESIVTLSFFGFLLLIMVVVFGVFSFNNVRLVNRGKIICIYIFTTAALLMGYYMVYAFSFTEREGIALASENRYLGSYILGIILWYVHLFLSNYKSVTSGNRFRGTCLVLCIGSLIFSGGYKGFQLAQQSVGYTAEGMNYARELRKYLNENDKVYYVGSGDDGWRFVQYEYYATPIRLNSPFFYNKDNGEREVAYIPRIGIPELYERQMSFAELEKELMSYDYMYIERTDEQFNHDYGELFMQSDKISSGMIYKIDKSNGKIKLFPYKKVYEEE